MAGVRHAIIAATVLLCAAILLYAVDYDSLSPAVLTSTKLVLANHPAGMDFFERYLGWSPDGGDGSYELMFLLMLVATTVAASLHFRFRR